MRTIIVFILCACSFSTLISQTDDNSSKAQTSFDAFAYNDVIKTLKKKSKTDLEEKRILGMSYWKVNNLTSAEDVFSQIMNSKEKTSEDVFSYANVLKENRDYEAYENWMKKFSEMAPEDSRAIEFIEHSSELTELREEDANHTIKRLNMNSREQDFGSSYYGDKLVFSSSRVTSKMIVRKWNGNEKAYLKTFTGKIQSNGELTEVEELNGPFNKKFHNGTLAFNSYNDMVIMTQNGKMADGGKAPMNLQLFISKKNNDKWEKSKPFPYNSKQYSCGQPSISFDNRWLYFVSDMPGGFGGTDIYRSEISLDGTFGEPENLGAEINTAGNEMFPLYYSLDGMLLYSSDGKLGLGGLDVFLAEVKHDFSVGEVFNPGAPLNSHKDDFGLILDSLQKKGYISSDRIGEGIDDDDLYAVSLAEPFSFDSKIIEGMIVDENGNPVKDAEVSFTDGNLGLLTTLRTDTSGMFRFAMDESGMFNIKLEKPGFGVLNHSQETGDRRVTTVTNLVMNSNLEVQFKFGVFDSQDKDPISNVTVLLTDKTFDDDMIDKTGDSGESLITLMTNPSLNSIGEFDLRIEKEGYLTKVIPFEIVFDHAGVYDLNQYLKKVLKEIKMEKVELGLDLNSVMNINPIYFDFAKYNIRPDAQEELEKIIKVMNENENIKIELRSHTDCRGGDSDNLRLSENRAKASELYVKERISNPERVTSQGYGESELINKCDDGVNCSESEHQENRRTEFIILEL